MPNEEVDDHSKSNPHDLYTKAYIGILNSYQNQIDKASTGKIKLKDQFFHVIKQIMYLLTGLFIFTIVAAIILFGIMVITNYQSISLIAGAITAIVSSFVTAMISIFKLPEIIATYLFNKEEDQTMSDIIKNIQEYEIRAVDSERALIRAEYDAAAVKSNSFIKQTVDEEIPPHSPNETSEQPENIESINHVKELINTQEESPE